MAEETSLKAPGPNRAIRVVVGVAAIGVLLAALAWMIPHFIAQPARATLTQETPMGMSSGYAPSMNVYDRKCLLSKKTLSLPAVTRRGLLIVYVYCACKILTNFTVIHCVMPFAVHCDNGSTQHRSLVFKFLIGQSSFRSLVFCIHKGRVAYPPRCRRKRAVRASLRISKN